MSGAAELAWTAEDLRRVCDLLYRRTGLVYGEAKRYFVERRLSERLGQSGAASVAAYLALLRRDAEEVERLINSVTVNETYFYREEHQFRCLGASLLPEIVARRQPGALVRIWSVPCATGEEPYSIAIWLLENWRLVDAYHIEIVGSDIDTAVLERARAGIYNERALSRLPFRAQSDYFDIAEHGVRHLIRDIRESVTLRPANLVDAASMAAQGRFDVIFCRNVLIYFDDQSRSIAAQNLFAALNPGGFLCLGHAESMARISDRFVARRFDDAVVFQRPEAA